MIVDVHPMDSKPFGDASFKKTLHSDLKEIRKKTRSLSNKQRVSNNASKGLFTKPKSKSEKNRKQVYDECLCDDFDAEQDIEEERLTFEFYESIDRAVKKWEDLLESSRFCAEMLKREEDQMKSLRLFRTPQSSPNALDKRLCVSDDETYLPSDDESTSDEQFDLARMAAKEYSEQFPPDDYTKGIYKRNWEEIKQAYYFDSSSDDELTNEEQLEVDRLNELECSKKYPYDAETRASSKRIRDEVIYPYYSSDGELTNDE